MSVQQLRQHLEPLHFLFIFYFFFKQEASWVPGDRISLADLVDAADPKGFSGAETRQKVCAAAFPAEPSPNKADRYLLCHFFGEGYSAVVTSPNRPLHKLLSLDSQLAPCWKLELQRQLELCLLSSKGEKKRWSWAKWSSAICCR